jgi:hypothetical protein
MKTTEGINVIRRYFPNASLVIEPTDPRFEKLVRRLHDLATEVKTSDWKPFIAAMDRLGLAVCEDRITLL